MQKPTGLAGMELMVSRGNRNSIRGCEATEHHGLGCG